MTGDGPRVRDFSDPQRTLPVEIDAAPVHEVLAALFVVTRQSDHKEFDAGSTYVERFEQYASAELKARLVATGGCGEAWLALVGVAHSLAGPRTVDALAAHLEAQDPVELRAQLMRDACMRETRGLSAATLQAAAGGAPDAVADVVSRLSDQSGLTELLGLPPEQTRSALVEVLRRFADEVYPKLEIDQSVRERDAEEKRALARSLTPARLVEAATNGVTFSLRPGVSRVVLIPSIAARPWVLIAEHAGLLVFVYPVSDDHLVSDPDMPPRYLVDLYKALADEKRLRILGMLSEAPMSLTDIAERLDLAKSTAHHHLRVLRSAGLVRVSIDEDRPYTLRPGAIPEAGPVLERYLDARRRGTS